jgi:N-acetyl-anhydromuramyl-L-alanine amidase AmpD
MINVADKTSNNNYSTERIIPQGVVLHITGDSEDMQAINWFQNPQAKVSSHYVIQKKGIIYQCVYPNMKAYHCGVVNKPTAEIYFDQHMVNPNSYMIGIEMVSSGEPLTEQQETSLCDLLLALSVTYKFTLSRYHIIGHNQLDSVDRAFDPISSYSVDDILDRCVSLKAERENKKDIDMKQMSENLKKIGILSPEYWTERYLSQEDFNTQYVRILLEKISKLKEIK